REVIERQVLGRFRDGAPELGTPRVHRLTGTRIDEIEGIAREDAPRDRDGVESLLGGVQPPERCERGVVQRLAAERDPVDSGRPVTLEAVGFDAGRVSLEGYLDIARDIPMPPHR